MFIYEIWLDNQLVGDSGDDIFDDEVSAELDAEYLLGYLMEEYNKPEDNFEIIMYEKEKPSNPPSENNEKYYVICNKFTKERKE